MHIEIYRDTETDKSTLGKLHLNNLTLDTLELPWRNNQEFKSRIPASTYRAHSRILPTKGWVIRLEDTKPRTDILIHAGNIPDDTKGCIVVGTGRGTDCLYDSRNAMNQLKREVEKTGKSERIEVTINDP